MPSQFNYDEDIGPEDDGQRYTLNIQPVVPFSLDEIGACRTLEILNVRLGEQDKKMLLTFASEVMAIGN